MKTILLPLLGICLLAACGGNPGGVLGNDNDVSFILISLDTTRADHVGTYGYERGTTPFLDSFAEEGLVFTQAITVTENTLFSHASMLTGLYPGAHGAYPYDGGVPLGESYTTLAEDFKARGYHTAGFAAHKDWLNSDFGIDQGFDVFKTGYRSADVVLAEANAWLDERKKEAEAAAAATAANPAKPQKAKLFFLFIHLFDVHSELEGVRPYDSPAPFDGRYTQWYDGPYKCFEEQQYQGSKFLNAVSDKKVDVSTEDITYFKGLYDEGLAYTDDRVGEFLLSLDREKVFVVITADHGEEFLEHGYMLHNTLFDQIVNIPFIMLPPPSALPKLGGARKIHDQISIVDLRATLATLANSPYPETCQGVDLIPWLTGKVQECPSRPAPLYDYVLRHDGYKYFKTDEGTALFNLERDPKEKHDLGWDPTPDNKRRIDEMESILVEIRAENAAIRKKHERLSQKKQVQQDEEALQRLKALGY